MEGRKIDGLELTGPTGLNSNADERFQCHSTTDVKELYALRASAAREASKRMQGAAGPVGCSDDACHVTIRRRLRM